MSSFLLIEGIMVNREIAQHSDEATKISQSCGRVLEYKARKQAKRDKAGATSSDMCHTTFFSKHLEDGFLRKYQDHGNEKRRIKHHFSIVANLHRRLEDIE